MINLKTTRRLLILPIVLALLLSSGSLAEVRKETVEEYGKVKRVEWKDTETGELTAGPEGYAAVEYSYSKQTTTERYYDADMEPYCMPGGYCGKKVTTDGKKQVVQIEYLDEDGRRTLNNDGYGFVTMLYTSFGAVRRLNYYGLKQLTVVPSLGYASVITDFRGKTVTKRTWLDEKKRPVDNAAGYAVMIQKVNKSNQVLGIEYQHADGTPATCEDGWSSCVKDRDSEGRLIRTIYYDERGNVTDRGAGYAWEEITYTGDEEQLISRFDVNGNRIAVEPGVFALKREVKNGLVVRESFLNENGEAVLNGQGVGAVLYGYDHLGRLEKVSYLDLTGASCLCRGGYAGYRDTRDADGAVVSRAYIGTDGLPAETAEGYSEVRYTYDETKNLVMTGYYDISGTQIKTE